MGKMCDVKSYNKCSKSSLSALTQDHNCFPARLLPCQYSKSAQKFAVRVRQVTTVAMATTQLVLRLFKNFSISTKNNW